MAAIAGRAIETAGESPDRSRRPRALGLDLVLVVDTVLMLCLLAAGYGQFDAANAAHGYAFTNLALLFLVATMTAPLLLRDRRPGLALTFSIMSTLWTIGVARKLVSAPAALAARYALNRTEIDSAARNAGDPTTASRIAALAAPGRRFLTFGGGRAVEVVGDLTRAGTWPTSCRGPTPHRRPSTRAAPPLRAAAHVPCRPRRATSTRAPTSP
jgi:hypothetical protein